LTVNQLIRGTLHEKNYTHLTKNERNEIQELLDKGYGVRAIARMLGRGIGTISEELKRNQVAAQYVAAKAHHKATVRRKAAKFQAKKIVANTKLERFIYDALLTSQSPGAIAGRLKAGLEPGLPYVSRDTIETYIRSIHGRTLLYELRLLKASQYRKNRRKRPGTLPPGDTKVLIDDRPAVITNRGRVGDLEVDFVVSGKTGSGYVLTAADRKLRVGFMRKILPVSVGNALQALLDIQQVFPELQSITTDNDVLFRYHTKLEQALGVPFFFCHPYSSWQKGSIENYNGQVRKYIKKGSNISLCPEDYIQRTAQHLNKRYMAVLGYKTPEEALEEYRASVTNNSAP